MQFTVDFNATRQVWKGFGNTYVEMSHSRDGAYEDYGGFSRISSEDRDRILDMIFGSDGIKPANVKMFLPSHLLAEPPEPGRFSLDDYRVSEHMKQTLLFAREGMRRSKADGRTLRFLATMYGPPAWATKQKVIRGRDLDPEMHESLATYMAGCVKVLREREGIPVQFISIHNEGEAFERYPGKPGDDFNMCWYPEQVATMIVSLRRQLDLAGLADVGIAPGETTNWSGQITYSAAILRNETARSSVGLITSHGFREDYNPLAIKRLRSANPLAEAWTTSTSWNKQGGAEFTADFIRQINELGINVLIPWALIQQPSKWVGGDPNPNPPFRVDDDRSVHVLKSYYYWRQLTEAGRPGARVAAISGPIMEDVAVLGFGYTDGTHADAIVVANRGKDDREVTLEVKGGADRYAVWRTDESTLSYTEIASIKSTSGRVVMQLPPMSSTTLFAVR